MNAKLLREILAQVDDDAQVRIEGLSGEISTAHSAIYFDDTENLDVVISVHRTETACKSR